MARKPGPGLPDVFAKPGGAPPRGTSIEDLPASASHPEEAAAEPAQVEAGADRGPVVSEADVTTDMPTEPPAPQTENSPPPPVSTHADRGVVRRSRFGDVPALVWGILVVSLSAPLWEGAVLSALGIRSPLEQVVAQDSAVWRSRTRD